MAMFEAGSSGHRPAERWVSVAIVAAALLLGLIVLWRSGHKPRTDDAEVFANLIGIAPQVEGPIVELKVQQNQIVKRGDLLFAIDPRPYEYELEKAESAQSALESQISDEERRIAAEV